MLDMDALFKSVGQALFFAFYMEVVPPTTKGATQILIEDLLKQRYGEPDLIAERTINMGTMTPLELRGQCAMIRAKVDKLADGERAALHARFGHQARRAHGVRSLLVYVEPHCSTRNDSALLALLWAIYSPRARGRPQDFSLRRIEKEYGVNKSTLHRDQQKIRDLCMGLEIRAQNVMDAEFIRSGLIPDPSFAAA